MTGPEARSGRQGTAARPDFCERAAPSPEIRLTPSDPAVRAAHLKEDLEALEKVGPAFAARVRARVRPETLDAIRAASRVDFLPVALNVEVVRAVHAEGGPEGTRRWTRASMTLATGAYLKPFLNLVSALFAPSPAALYKYVPRAWALVYRNCGRIEVEDVGPGVTRIVCAEFPPELRSPEFAASMGGTLESIFDLCAYDGRVQVDPTADGSVRYVATWSRRAEGRSRPG